MTDVLIRASLYPASTRLAVAALFTWQGAALLAVATAGVMSAGCVLRAFPRRRQQADWTLTAVCAVAFAAWSLVVVYSALFALVVLVTVISALAFGSAPPSSGDVQPRTAASALPGQHRHTSPVPALASWLWGTATAALPVLSGLAFYWWLESSPKSWADPACGLPGWLPLTAVLFVAVPAAMAWVRTRALGKSRGAATVALVVATAVTIGTVVVAFLFWFGLNRCGE